jgi:hypothetical protein
MIKLPIEKCKVSFNALNEDSSVRGNYILSDDEDFDRKCENEIQDRINDGDEYAWFCARVSVSHAGITEDTYLGCCNYNNEKQFLESGCYQDMIEEARVKLETRLQELSNNLKSLDKE